MTWGKVPCPPLVLHCSIDHGPRWFDPSDLTLDQGFSHLRYTCRNCRKYEKTISVILSRLSEDNGDAEVMKLGEYPPFGAPISARIQKLLEESDLELYRKGARAEAQGLGIGAASYYRRIVESQWKLLVSEIRDAATQLGFTDVSLFEAALSEKRFATAVEILKDAIPGKLLILDGRNPLTLLHQPLSVELHSLSDEECLQQAADIRLVLTALLENIADVLKDQAELKGAVERLGRPRG